MYKLLPAKALPKGLAKQYKPGLILTMYDKVNFPDNISTFIGCNALKLTSVFPTTHMHKQRSIWLLFDKARILNTLAIFPPRDAEWRDTVRRTFQLNRITSHNRDRRERLFHCDGLGHWGEHRIVRQMIHLCMGIGETGEGGVGVGVGTKEYWPCV